MHPCLAIQEIFSTIVSHLPEDDGFQRRAISERMEKPRTLAALARTCKTFYPVATSRLWAVQDTLDNLMGCLPESSWYTDEEGLMVNPLYLQILSVVDAADLSSQILRQDFPHDGWTNFDFHAQLVRELSLSDRKSDTGTIERTLSALSRFHPEAPHGILPHTTVVHAFWASAVTFIGLMTLLGSEVQYLHFRNYDASPDVDTVTSIPPSLRGLDLRAHARDLFSVSLGRWVSSIRELHLQGAILAMHDLIAIAPLPHLSYLELNCMSSWQEEQVDIPSTNSPWFSSLETLDLNSMDSVSNCTTFLEKFRPNLLTGIRVEGRHDLPPSIEAPSELYDLVNAFTTPELSKTLTSVVCEVFADFYHSVVITFAEIEPLRSLSLLTTLSLYFECDWHFTNHDFGVIAESWPSMKKLSLCYSYDYLPSHGPPTTQALVKLAMHPQLEEITLSFNSSVIVPTAGVTNTRIRSLSPFEVWLEPSDIPAMAEFLRELLPTVYERGVVTDFMLEEEGWWDLNDYIQSQIRGPDSDSEDEEQENSEGTGSSTDTGTEGDE